MGSRIWRGKVTLRPLSDLRGDALVDGVLELVTKHKPIHVSSMPSFRRPRANSDFFVMAYPAAVSSTLPDSDGPFHSQLGTLIRVRRRALHAVRRRRLEFVPLGQENEDW